MLTSAPSATRSVSTRPSPSPTCDQLLLPTQQLANPKPTQTTSRATSTSTSGSASLVTCHVCGDQARKSSFALHQRKCIRDHIGRLSLDRTAHSLLHSSSPTHQCTSCLQFVAAHLFSHHLRTCQGKPAIRPYTTPAPAQAPVAAPSSARQFTNGVRSPLPPIELLPTSSPVRAPGMGRTVSDSIVDYAPPPPKPGGAGITGAVVRPTSRLGAVLPLTLPSFASDPAIHVAPASPLPPAPQPITDDQPNESSADTDMLDRVPCPLCGRKFVPESLPRHEQACAKINAKRRPVFNAQAKRVKGTELEKFVQIGTPGGEDSGSNGKKPKKQAHQPIATHDDTPVAQAPSASAAPMAPPAWKAKSDAMRSVMKAARLGHTAPAQDNPDYVPCPTCGRKFNEEAAKRHLQTCAERKQREEFAAGGKRAAGGGTGAGGAGGAGEDMLMRRIKYQPPLPGAKKKKQEAAGGNVQVQQQQHPAGAAQPQARGRPCCPGCGAGYLTQEAKFCFECGTRRTR
ncbi:hypothetical protein BCR44DRAFT_52009 [Catenaria anguillulae PL171]|uniref:C2HC/C3H-type domain-containing protein n=1 Tax=Catenaria anguillulae PL171 TaxID=765915 RepID=A0A1Y2HHX8_9FUNG|nr:hypothetical protein BCR44DRAFT_52009 [Catenaria anguillulae PL171]